jgi:hypothetical protein
MEGVGGGIGCMHLLKVTGWAAKSVREKPGKKVK